MSSLLSVDVEKAEATVESDRQRIIDDIDAGVGQTPTYMEQTRYSYCFNTIG